MRHIQPKLKSLCFTLIVIIILLSSNRIIITNAYGQNKTIVSTYGTIQVQNPIDVIFECGGETGMLSPPFDFVGAGGAGTTAGAGVIIDSNHVRSGSKAIKIYQPAPPKSDAQRRVGLKIFGGTIELKTFYASWWMYFPSGFEDVVNPSDPQWGPVIGGVTSYWAALGDQNYPSAKGMRFRFIINANMKCWIYFSGFDATGDTPSLGNYEVFGSPSYKQINEEEWVHFQVYWNTGSPGKCRAWIDDTLIFDENVYNDPTYWGEPESGDSFNEDGSSYPKVLAESYCSQDTLAHELWVDDVVIATEKVPESYGIND